MIKRSPLFYLTLAMTLLMLFVSLYGLLNQGIYEQRQNAMTLYELMGQDLVSFIVGVLLLCMLLLTNTSKISSIVVILGCLSYILYVYGYFCFGIVTSIFFFLYIIILLLAFFAFILILVGLQKRTPLFTLKANYPRKSMTIFVIIMISVIGMIEIHDIILKTIIKPGGFRSQDVFYILDLALLFPAIIYCAILNFKKNLWGVLLTGVFLVKTITLLPAVIGSDILHRIGTGKFVDLTFDIIASVITIGFAVFFVLFLRGIEKD